MPRYIIIILASMLFSFPTFAGEKRDLSSILNRLDSVIGEAPKYEAAKQARIAALYRQLHESGDSLSSYNIRMRIYEEYHSYKSDSALVVLRDNQLLARAIHRRDLENDCLSLIAFQCSSSGHYPDAREALMRVDTTKLRGKGFFYYYRANLHLYSEMGYYSHIDKVRDSMYNVAGKYESLLFTTLDKRSWDYKYYLCRNLFNNGKPREALKVCDEWLRMTPANSRDYALVAYYQYLIRISMRYRDDALYWAARSAISDITHAVMDQASLWAIADIISGDDIGRANRYIRFSWQCAMTFGADVRAMQISPILSVVETQYQSQLNKANHRLMAIMVLIALLALSLWILLYYVSRQRQKLALARNELSERNRQLADSNAKLHDSNVMLQEANERITAVNERLHESDQIKETYIGRFLALCSDYVDRMDKGRRTANKMIKAHKADEFYQMTRSAELKDKDLEELYGYFDSTFLNIFPTFVTDFNSLLKPECRIETEPGKLNTTLRIFALIRLGIDDSGKIASFLHYSVNTIYNYRARTKNGCIGNRDTFEDRVKRLGKIGG